MISTVLGVIVLIAVLGGAFVVSRRNSRRRVERVVFIRGYRFPAGLRFKLHQAYPELSDEQTALILEGLRAWFLLLAENPSARFGMPSKAVDTAWHEFILLTHQYAAFCDQAFGKFLHHVPHAGDTRAEADGLAMTFGTRSSLLGAGAMAAGAAGGFAAAAIASPRDLFGIDQTLGIATGNRYSEEDFARFEKRHAQISSAGAEGGGGGDSGSSSCVDGSCGEGGSGGSGGDGGSGGCSGGGCGGGGCGS